MIAIGNITLTLVLRILSATNFVMAIDCVRLFSIKTYRAAFCASHHKNENTPQRIPSNKRRSAHK